ncbi:hypothetical protein BC938DRAFT_473594 [Jimgerdemannia flammicorona]|uniref:Uncharacterized protein n=1 Tax=Jimgerdemannia flammicorona TaxID=994334 RepID=A0A433Q3S6_9FUNG|nr:hypothetical protein BC938DRAFT_473594 [Jimgerdemannia flammicorona]
MNAVWNRLTGKQNGSRPDRQLSRTWERARKSAPTINFYNPNIAGNSLVGNSGSINGGTVKNDQKNNGEKNGKHKAGDHPPEPRTTPPPSLAVPRETPSKRKLGDLPEPSQNVKIRLFECQSSESECEREGDDDCEDSRNPFHEIFHKGVENEKPHHRKIDFMRTTYFMPKKVSVINEINKLQSL